MLALTFKTPKSGYKIVHFEATLGANLCTRDVLKPIPTKSEPRNTSAVVNVGVIFGVKVGVIFDHLFGQR